MYDAIVVGARAAGSPTAMLLARKGHRVLLLDRAEFPSDTLSTHQLQVPGVARLAELGVLDQVLASGAPPTRRKLPSSKTRRSLACMAGGISAISSMKSVPPSATSIRPGLVCTAPVKAPFS